MASLHFDGETFDANLDGERLANQLGRVRRLMGDAQWRSLREISAATGDPESSVSARLRDLRKPRFGNHVISRRRRGVGNRGIYEYKMSQEQLDWVDQFAADARPG